MWQLEVLVVWAEPQSQVVDDDDVEVFSDAQAEVLFLVHSSVVATVAVVYNV